MQWFWPLSWFNHAFLSSCSRKDTHAWPKFSFLMSLSLWIAYYEKIQIDDSNPYSLSTSSQFTRYHVIFLARTSTCHHRAHARSWWRISSRPCCAAACGAQFSTAASAQGDLKGEMTARCWPNWPNPWNWPSSGPRVHIPPKGKVPGDCRGIWIRC